MKDKQVLRLKWRGPWKFTDGKSDIAPQKKVPGVYLWVVGGPDNRHVSYVGQSSDLRQRFYDHMISILGGGYWLYKPETLTDVLPVCEEENISYKPNPDELNTDFVTQYDCYSKVAKRNLESYEIFWAEITGQTTAFRMSDDSFRKSVESLFIAALMSNEKTKVVLQNERRSLSWEEEDHLEVISNFPEGIQIAGLKHKMRYPEQ